MKSETHWSVEVTRNGESLVTISSNCLSGKPTFTAEEAQTIRDAARHLEAFIGSGPHQNAVGDWVCEHGTAMDVHCCNCHSGFLFDSSKCICF